MSDYIVCSHCGRKELGSQSKMCECGSYFCCVVCVAKSLSEVGFYIFEPNTTRYCGRCVVNLLETGALYFREEDIEVLIKERLMVPKILNHVVNNAYKQMSLF